MLIFGTFEEKSQISVKKKNGFFFVVILRSKGIEFFILKEDRVDPVNSESRPNHPSLPDLVPSLTDLIPSL